MTHARRLGVPLAIAGAGLPLRRARLRRRSTGTSLLGSHPPPPDRPADLHRPADRRDHDPAGAALGDGPAPGRHPARPLGAGGALALPAAHALPALGRSEGDDPGHRPVRRYSSAAAHGHGDRSEAGAPRRARRHQRRRRRSLGTLHRRRRLRQLHARLAPARTRASPGLLPLPRHGARHLLGQGRGHDRARYEFPAPRHRAGDRRLGGDGRHHGLDHHRHHLQPGAPRHSRSSLPGRRASWAPGSSSSSA